MSIAQMQPNKKEHATHRRENSKENPAAPREEQRLSRRRKRTKFEPHQVKVLKAFFAKNSRPSYQERVQLGKELNIPEDRVAVWFQNRRARHLKPAKPNAVKQKKTKKTPSQGRAPPKRVACQPKWPGNCGKEVQPGRHWGQDQPVYQHYYHPFPQGTVNHHESRPFATGQATSSLGSNINLGPSFQNLPFGFGGAGHHLHTQPQQSQQHNYSWNSCFNYNTCSGQEDPQWSFGTQQPRGQSCVAQHQHSVSSASGSSLEDILSYLEEDGYAQIPSFGSSPLLYGGEAEKRVEYRPTGTYSCSHSSSSSTAQGPGSCQWENLPNQYSPINY